MKILTSIGPTILSDSSTGDASHISKFILSELIDLNVEIDVFTSIHQDHLNSTFEYENLNELNFINDIEKINNDYDFILMHSDLMSNDLVKNLNRNVCKSDTNKTVLVSWGMDESHLTINSNYFDIFHILFHGPNNSIDTKTYPMSMFSSFVRKPILNVKEATNHKNIIIGCGLFSKESSVNYKDEVEFYRRVFNHFSKKYDDIFFDILLNTSISWFSANIESKLYLFEQFELIGNIRYIHTIKYKKWLKYLSKSMGYIQSHDRDFLSYTPVEIAYLKVPLICGNTIYFEDYNKMPKFNENNSVNKTINIIEKLINFNDLSNNDIFLKNQLQNQNDAKLMIDSDINNMKESLRKIVNKMEHLS